MVPLPLMVGTAPLMVDEAAPLTVGVTAPQWAGGGWDRSPRGGWGFSAVGWRRMGPLPSWWMGLLGSGLATDGAAPLPFRHGLTCGGAGRRPVTSGHQGASGRRL